MRLLTCLTALLALSFVLPVLAQDIDGVKVDPAHHRVVFENDQVRVVRWIIPVGDKTLKHTHPDSVNINLTDYNGRVTVPGRKPYEFRDKAGSVSWRPFLTHVVENIGSQPMEGFIVEPKKPASARPADSPDPVAVDPKHHKVVFENEQIRVIREQREPGEFALHGHPDSLQVLLTDGNATLITPNGESQALIGKAGEVRWRAATQHRGTVLGQKPVEAILIEMKGAPGKGAGR